MALEGAGVGPVSEGLFCGGDEVISAMRASIVALSCSGVTGSAARRASASRIHWADPTASVQAAPVKYGYIYGPGGRAGTVPSDIPSRARTQGEREGEEEGEEGEDGDEGLLGEGVPSDRRVRERIASEDSRRESVSVRRDTVVADEDTVPRDTCELEGTDATPPESLPDPPWGADPPCVDPPCGDAEIGGVTGARCRCVKERR